MKPNERQKKIAKLKDSAELVMFKEIEEVSKLADGLIGKVPKLEEVLESFGVEDGKDGADGKDGKDGVDGKDGLDGKDGINGKDGKDGIDGKPGRDGVDGKDGVDGENYNLTNDDKEEIAGLVELSDIEIESLKGFDTFRLDANRINNLPLPGGRTGGGTAEILDDGTKIGSTHRINFGSNLTVSIVDGVANINAAEGTGHVIQDEGVNLTERKHLNFVGAGVTATDDPGNDATVVTIPSGGVPAGSDTEVQFNDNGAFGTSSTFKYLLTTKELRVDNSTMLSTGTDAMFGHEGAPIKSLKQGSTGETTLSSGIFTDIKFNRSGTDVASFESDGFHLEEYGSGTITGTSAKFLAVTAGGLVIEEDAPEGNATHTGDVTGSVALTIAADVVDNTKLANMSANTIKLNSTGSTGGPTDTKVSSLTEGTPSSGDWLLGEESTGAMRKFPIDQLNRVYMSQTIVPGGTTLTVSDFLDSFACTPGDMNLVEVHYATYAEPDGRSGSTTVQTNLDGTLMTGTSLTIGSTGIASVTGLSLPILAKEVLNVECTSLQATPGDGLTVTWVFEY